jgi:hypothetical protein
MRRCLPVRAAIAATLLAAMLGGCSIGAGSSGSGAAKLTVTRDFGAKALLRASEARVPAGETVMRFLQRRAKVETRYGGRFVNGINRVRSGQIKGERADWFYYVNGIEAGVSAAERVVEAGDSVWWDYHDWAGAMRIPAVVGSFPEPFLHGSEGKRFPIRIDCADAARPVCRELAGRLEQAGIDASSTALGAPGGKQLLRFVVGEWGDVRRDAAARQIEGGPKRSGVFAQFGARRGGYELDLMNALGQVSRRVPAGGGLVAATRFQEQQPTWVIAGADRTGLERAAKLVDQGSLRDRFALAATESGSVSLPLANAGARR